jgi:hypothetical protein
MRAPPAGRDAARLEADVLACADVDPHALLRLRRAALGTRRVLRLPVPDIDIAFAAAIDDRSDGLTLSFRLLPVADATRLLAELMLPRPPRSHEDRSARVAPRCVFRRCRHIVKTASLVASRCFR